MIAVLTYDWHLASFFLLLLAYSLIEIVITEFILRYNESFWTALIPVYSHIIIVIRNMTNTNSYDCSYEKPLLEGIMDILRFMDGWTKKIADRNIKVI